MINLSSATNMAQKLTSASKQIDLIIKDYQEALSQLNNNSSNSTTKYIEEINNNIRQLQNCKVEIQVKANIIINKAKEIRAKEEQEQNK